MNAHLDAGDRPLAAVVAGVRDVLAGAARLDDEERIELIGALEELKNLATAVQVRLSADFAHSQRAEQAGAGVPAAQRGRGVAEQVALARRQSPHQGRVFLGVAMILTREMRHTLAAMAAGRLTEYQAQILVQETSCLSRDDHADIDRVLCEDLSRLDGVGTRRLAALVRHEAYQRDPHAAVERIARAENERYVTLRPAPDCMTRLTALLPLAQGVAVYAALTQAADTARATGDERRRGQVMSDTLVTRVTGQDTPEAVPVGVHLIMPADTLLSSDSAPARILGHGSIPAAVARRLVTAAPAVQSWIKRLYASPSGGLIGTDSHARLFPDNLAEFITIRDDTCRTPYCDAPIRHLDHIRPAAYGGPTSVTNGQGLCEQCNHAKQAPGWHTMAITIATPSPTGIIHTGQHHTLTTTPTHHTYTGHSPG